MEQKDNDFDEWYGREWCKICAITIGMVKLELCDWQNKLRAQGKECPKLFTDETQQKNNSNAEAIDIKL